MRPPIRQGLYGAVAWVVVGTIIRVALDDATAVDALLGSLPGAVAFGVVYAAVVHWRSD